MGSSISGVTLGSGSGVLVEDGLCGKHWRQLFAANLRGFISECGTDTISTFKASNPCKDANKPDLST